MRNGTPRWQLPAAALLRSYAAGMPSDDELAGLPVLGRRCVAVRGAAAGVLDPGWLDAAGDAAVAERLAAFYEACVWPPLHGTVVRERAGVLRHALGYLLRGRDPLPVKMEACLVPEGPYHVPGLGPNFWSALVQGMDPARHAAWTPAVVRGLRRLGLIPGLTAGQPGEAYAAIQQAFDECRRLEPGLSALHVHHFLVLVAVMPGRELPGREATAGATPDVETALRDLRARSPLRRLLKERGRALDEARNQMEAGLRARDGRLIRQALGAADPSGVRRAPVDWRRRGEDLTLWVGRLWESDQPDDALAAWWQADPLAGAGLWLGAAVLALREPSRFFAWDEGARNGYTVLDDAVEFTGTPIERYRLFNAGLAGLCQRFAMHPLEAPGLLAALASGPLPADESASVPARTTVTVRGRSEPRFRGFCPDTFVFLAELEKNNARAWMDRQRGRYRYAVREPLVELCRTLADRYVRPVLRGEHGWDLETEARSGRALTSVCKNDYGRSVPYQTELWITFHRRRPRREDVQFFVRLDTSGLAYGLRLGSDARHALDLFRRNLDGHAEALFRALDAKGAFGECRLGSDDGPAADATDAAALRAWAAGKSLVVAKSLPPDAALLRSEELVGDIILTFDRLLPAYACAVREDPGAFLPAGPGGAAPRYGEADFGRDTFLDPEWLARARQLLGLKKQLILQGVPGTGKTHVARALARLLADGNDDAVRLVQLHPAYSYEEFVEGIKVRSVDVNGRAEVTYPVEDGVLCAFAAAAERRPDVPHVLVIDEINRANLPRVFGELLFLLEYRGQEVALPYSRRPFRLPANLYVLGTMNAADRSVALVDQALRRRFSFLEMPPDAAVLSAWLRAHPPAAGSAFAAAAVGLFERLNARLRADLGPHAQVGHSYFMVPDLDEARLQAVWEHHVRPLLEESGSGRPGRGPAYRLEDFRGGPGRRSQKQERRPAAAAR